jgi:hypothetical protein
LLFKYQAVAQEYRWLGNAIVKLIAENAKLLTEKGSWDTENEKLRAANKDLTEEREKSAAVVYRLACSIGPPNVGHS